MTGFDSKRQAALDKFFETENELGLHYEPEQEPVAYCYVQKGTSVDILTFDDAPDDAVDGTIFPLYTTPSKREWVGLTPADIESLSAVWWKPNQDEITLIDWVEAKLKEKNFD